jgi:hypothetical protein
MRSENGRNWAGRRERNTARPANQSIRADRLCVLARWRAEGHEIIAVTRSRRSAGYSPHESQHVAMDIACATTQEACRPHLAGVDAVVNCADALTVSVSKGAIHSVPAAIGCPRDDWDRRQWSFRQSVSIAETEGHFGQTSAYEWFAPRKEPERPGAREIPCRGAEGDRGHCLSLCNLHLLA